MKNNPVPLTVRPKAAAAMLDIGLSSLWLKVKQDPAFPRPVKLSAATTVFKVADLQRYIDEKAAA